MHGLFGVVVALDDLAAAAVAVPRVRGRVLDGVDRPAGDADAAVGDALDDDVLGHVEVDHGVDRVAARDVLELAGLGHGPGEAVEDVARLRVGLAEPLLDDAEHDLVGHQLAAVHDGLGPLPELGTGPHRGAQHVTGRDVGYVVAHRQPLGLGALAGALPPSRTIRTPWVTGLPPSGLTSGSPRSCASSAGCRSASSSRAPRRRR